MHCSSSPVHMEIRPFIDRIRLTHRSTHETGATLGLCAPDRMGGWMARGITYTVGNIDTLTDQYTLPHFMRGVAPPPRRRKINYSHAQTATMVAGRNIEGGCEFAKLDVQSFPMGLYCASEMNERASCEKKSERYGGDRSLIGGTN